MTRVATIPVIFTALVFAAPAVAAHHPGPELTRGQARYYSEVALLRYFKGGFDAGGSRPCSDCQFEHQFNPNCTKRLSRVRIRCAVGWYLGDWAFSGHTTIWLTPASGGGIEWNYAFSINRLDTYCSEVEHRPESVCTKQYRVR